MKNLLIIPVVLIIFSSCNEENIDPGQFINDPNHPALKNKLKTSKEIFQRNNARVDYFYNSRGYLTKEEVYEDDKLTLTHIYERDINGRKTKEYSYSSQAAPGTDWTYFAYEYSDNKLVKQTYFNGGIIQWEKFLKYEEDLLTESLTYEDEQLIVVDKATYDSLGRLLKSSAFDETGEFLGYTRREYLGDTVLIHYSNERGVESPVTYQEIYNSDGQIEEEAYMYLPPTGRRVTSRYFYNTSHFLEESHHFDAGVPESAGPLSIRIYAYF